MAERRPRAYKQCPVDDCDWQLVTEWFVGGPDTVEVVPMARQQELAGEHMKTHYTPERTHFT